MKDKQEEINKQIAKDIKQDFLNRQKERLMYERKWQLNQNFLLGNQNFVINSFGDLMNDNQKFSWQENLVFNHIAPIMEARISKLCSIKPNITVVPSSESDADESTAKLGMEILKIVSAKQNLADKINKAINYSEIYGTSFYKIVWNSNAGKTIGLDTNSYEIKEGEVDISVCSPFEIFPENNQIENLANQPSIIHAKVVDVSQIKKDFGVDVEPDCSLTKSFEDVVYNKGNNYGNGIVNTLPSGENSVLLLEKYEAPNSKLKNGRITIVAGDKLLAVTDLPFANGEDGKRIYPFVKQCSSLTPNCFWGTSVIERLIPVQRSFNAVKNRKHEFLNRLSLGVVAVEDGSVDVDNLEEEGLQPGKVIVYRQGATAPQIMQSQSLPVDFKDEEEKLLNEFTNIGGISDMLLNNKINGANLSGTALGIIKEQESSRLQVSADEIYKCAKQIGIVALRLYKQFVSPARLSKLYAIQGNKDLFYFNKSDISADDIIIETKTDLGESVTAKREMVFRLLDNNLLFDNNGQMSSEMRVKVLKMLGFGSWENRTDLTELHIKKASRENVKMLNNQTVSISELDDHNLHINEHISFTLTEEFESQTNEKQKQQFYSHINQHKKLLKYDENKQNGENK